MPPDPLAYFITFSAYGMWLHGRSCASVDKQNNQPGTPFLPPDKELEQRMRANMREAPYVLTTQRRVVILDTIREVAQHRGWGLWACHVRTTHVHAIVSGNAEPEKTMSDFKAYASRRLKERLGEPADCKRWTQHGSTLYLWREDKVAAKIVYVLDGQGTRMDAYDGREPDQIETSEPEA